MTKPRIYSEKQAAERRRERHARHVRRLSVAGREIGPLPEPKHQAKREAARRDLRFFLETFLGRRFPLPWGRPQLELIEALQAKLLKGGRHAVALPRGSGKTSIIVGAAVWASVYGHRSFLVLVGATAELAAALLRDYRAEIETNDLLAAAFPEVVYPIRALEGLSTRRAGQTLNKKRTLIYWSDRKAALPTVTGYPSSGCVVQSLGLLGSLRGLVHKVGGRTVRPDMIVVDDFQTRNSATMPSQVVKRLSILTGDVLGLAGPGDPVSAFVAGTVIVKGDGMDQLLDRKANPTWQGVRVRMLEAEPEDKDGWHEYARVRAEDLATGGTGKIANTFYQAKRQSLDRGGAVSWPARKLPGEVSAIQHAINLRLDLGEAAFAAEYQNEPIPAASSLAAALALTPSALATKVVPTLPRGTVPRDAVKLTVGIDCQDEIFPWLLCAWNADGSGHVVDYGTWPEQTVEMWATPDPPVKLSAAYPGKGQAARWWSGLTDLVNLLAARAWPREELDDPARIERVGIDAGYGKSTDLVYTFARRSAHAALVIPTHGRGIGPARQPMALWGRKPGELAGLGYRIQSAAGSARGRHLMIDTNAWKSRVTDAIRLPPGSPGGVTFAAGTHPLLFAHLCAEFPTPTSGPYGSVDVWAARPESGGQNHYLDALTIAATLAAALGLTTSAHALPATPAHIGPPPPLVSHRKLAEAAREGRPAGNTEGQVSHRALALAVKEQRETEEEMLTW